MSLAHFFNSPQCSQTQWCAEVQICTFCGMIVRLGYSLKQISDTQVAQLAKIGGKF